MQDDVAFMQTWSPLTKIRNLSLISGYSPSAKMGVALDAQLCTLCCVVFGCSICVSKVNNY